jgi:predicted  nucleic acid-binding Zn-ribbon protein
MNKLDEAKINLKKTLEKLEKAIDKRIISSKSTVAIEVMNKINSLQEEVNTVSHLLNDKKDEIEYLREQNSELQAMIGLEQQKNFSLEAKNRETARRIDEIIGEVKNYMKDRGVSEWA